MKIKLSSEEINIVLEGLKKEHLALMNNIDYSNPAWRTFYHDIWEKLELLNELVLKLKYVK